MGKLWIIALTVLLTSCAASNGRGKFVSTPVPNEIRRVVYSTQTPVGTKVWQLNNDDLKINSSAKLASGKVLSNQSKKMKANDMNWVIFNLSEADFTNVKSPTGSRNSAGKETLVVVTNEGSHTFTQNAGTRFPSGFQQVIDIIPKLGG